MILIFLALLAFGFVHSWLAGAGIKQTIRQRVGDRAYEGFYRMGYNLLAIVTLAPVFALVVLQSGGVVWHVEGVPALLLLAIQGIGALGMIASVLQIDGMRFIGLSQIRAYLNGSPLPLPEEPLQLKGVYALVRHPLYLFSLMMMWPFATMTESLLAFNLASTLYFIFGSMLEERRLLEAYGDTYRTYQQRVSWLIPIPRIRL
jgi:protein-S-isoprenylcysteine O-methyltransferase Ste14